MTPDEQATLPGFPATAPPVHHRGAGLQVGLYAAAPGTGPAGERCGTCRHAERFRTARQWSKCGLVRAFWTGGRGTDIRLRTPACSKWEAP